jgi:hypothetical protein
MKILVSQNKLGQVIPCPVAWVGHAGEKRKPVPMRCVSRASMQGATVPAAELSEEWRAKRAERKARRKRAMRLRARRGRS